MKRISLLPLLLAALTACDTGPSAPEPVASVEILQNAAPVTERTIQIGETVQLTAQLRDEAGQPLSGRSVSWQSSRPSVATVDSTGLVTGISPGTATITASAEGVSSQVEITVAAQVSVLECEEGDPGLDLAVGEVHTVSAAGSPILCVAGGTTGSEYVLVPFNAAEGASTLQVEVAGAGIVEAVGPPNPALFSREASGQEMTVPAVHEDHAFHLELRQREKRELTPLMRGGPGPALSRISAAEVPSVGDTVRFNVNANSACSSPDMRLARVEAVSDRAVVYADTGNPTGGFTREEYAGFAEAFDDLVWPVVTQNFGEPTDIDDLGGRVVILFTRAVNELTPASSSSYVAGFFFGRDLFPTTSGGGFAACPGSNVSEMFYMLVPDPNREAGRAFAKSFVASRTVGVIAHEFQHLINASRRLRVISTQNWSEEVWLNEGLSHIAEELIFYATTPFDPRENIDIDDLSADQTSFQRFSEHQWSNFSRYIRYLQNPRDQSLMGQDEQDDDLETRGATWAFLRYAADRHGGSDQALWRSLVDSDRLGLANLNASLGANTLNWMHDWTVAVYADDAVPTSLQYQQPSWNFRSIITGVRDPNTGAPLYRTFPLQVRQLQQGQENRDRLRLQGGGAAFIRFGIVAGAQAALRATSGDAPAPQRLMISLLRTK